MAQSPITIMRLLRFYCVNTVCLFKQEGGGMEPLDAQLSDDVTVTSE